MPEKSFKNKKEFQSEAYRLYQLDWMRSHGYGPEDIAAYFLAYLSENGFDEGGDTEKCYREWELDSGFGPQIWASRDEFLGHEYKDPSYMLALLPAWMHPYWYREALPRK